MPPMMSTTASSHHQPLPALPFSDDVSVAGAGGGAADASLLCAGAAGVGLSVGASVLVGEKDLVGSSEAVTDGRADEPLPLAPQAVVTTRTGSTTRHVSARASGNGAWGDLFRHRCRLHFRSPGLPGETHPHRVTRIPLVAGHAPTPGRCPL